MRLGRERPRKENHPDAGEPLRFASMRLGRERPRKAGPGRDWRAEPAGFNEAGARTPQKARGTPRERICAPPSFNEAGARTPQKGRG